MRRCATRLACAVWLASACMGVAVALGQDAPGTPSTSDDRALADAIAAGDAHWRARAEGEVDGRPKSGPIDRAIAAYAQAVELDPAALEPRWKLLRALHFAGEFLEQEKERKRERFARATDLAEASLERLDERLGGEVRLHELADRPDELQARIRDAGLEVDDVARLHFWSGIDWGAWSQTVGLLSAVRQGVAKRLYRNTSVAVALEPEYDEGGPLRLLGSLHAQLPEVPFLTGWVDRDEALPLITRAYDLYPENPGNQLLLARALLDLAPERRGEAISLLERVASSEPRPTMRIEDLAMREQARERLRELGVADA